MKDIGGPSLLATDPASQESRSDSQPTSDSSSSSKKTPASALAPSAATRRVSSANECNADVKEKKLFIAAVYDSEAPTKSFELEMNAHTLVIDFIDFITARCSARMALKNTPSSSIFYAEGNLYIDHRFDTFNYEKPLSTFLATNGHLVKLVDLCGYKSCMTVDQVKIEEQKPYVLLHNGDCEHIVMFNHVCGDVCLMNDKCNHHDVNENEYLDDIMNFAFGGTDNSANMSQDKFSLDKIEIAPLGNKPRETWRRPIRVFPCDLCKARMAIKFTVVDPIADKVPFHYCLMCFGDAHYTRDGRLLPSSQQLRVYDHQYLPKFTSSN